MADNQLPPPGWYPSSEGDGESQYWDGLQWHVAQNPNTKTLPLESNRKKTLILGLVFAGIAFAIGITVFATLWGAFSNAVMQAERDILIAEQLLAEQAQAELDKKQAREAAEEAQRLEDLQLEEQQREFRESTLRDIESAIAEHATESVNEGFLTGPILFVQCSPIAGGSGDILFDKTTTFECFVANEEKADGTSRGFFYSATMNWETNYYTYSYGRP